MSSFSLSLSSLYWRPCQIQSMASCPVLLQIAISNYSSIYKRRYTPWFFLNYFITNATCRKKKCTANISLIFVSLPEKNMLIMLYKIWLMFLCLIFTDWWNSCKLFWIFGIFDWHLLKATWPGLCNTECSAGTVHGLEMYYVVCLHTPIHLFFLKGGYVILSAQFWYIG